jgi:hypothetical protein
VSRSVTYGHQQIRAGAIPAQGAWADAWAAQAGSGRARPAALRRLAALAGALALAGCAALAPLQAPPLDPAESLDLVTTRAEAISRFGPPHDVRSSDLGPVLVYRRAVVIEENPHRYYGEDWADRLNRYERVLLYLDPEGRVVRRAIESE